MTSGYLKRIRSLDEVYAAIDKKRADVARAVQRRFHDDIDAAMALIASIGSIASARVLADSRVASANVLMDAECAATQLLAEAERKASRCINEGLPTQKEMVEIALQKIKAHTAAQLTSSAKEAVDEIQRGAQTAIIYLREAWDAATRNIQDAASEVAAKTSRDAGLAANKSSCFSQERAHIGRSRLRRNGCRQNCRHSCPRGFGPTSGGKNAALDKINENTDAACSTVNEAALAAKQKIDDACKQALLRLSELLRLQP